MEVTVPDIEYVEIVLPASEYADVTPTGDAPVFQEAQRVDDAGLTARPPSPFAPQVGSAEPNPRAAPFQEFVTAVEAVNTAVQPHALAEMARLRKKIPARDVATVGHPRAEHPGCPDTAHASPTGLDGRHDCGRQEPGSPCTECNQARAFDNIDAVGTRPAGGTTGPAVLRPFPGKREPGKDWYDSDTEARWKDLSRSVQETRQLGVGSLLNPVLIAEAAREPDLLFAPLYPLWALDSYAMEGAYEPALAVAREFLRVFRDRTFRGIHVVDHVLRKAGHCARSVGGPGEAEQYFRELVRVQRSQKRNTGEAWYLLGELYEEEGHFAKAAAAYAKSAQFGPRGSWQTSLAERNAERLRTKSRASFRPRPEMVARQLMGALRHRDAAALETLASRTHFMVGDAGHFNFASRATFLRALAADLRPSSLSADTENLDGHGGKRYLITHGWGGRIFRGRVRMLITESVFGWEWSGLAFDDPSCSTLEFLREQFGHPDGHDNDPLAVPIKAPWPAGLSFMAGGVAQFAGVEAAELANLGIVIAGAAAGCLSTLWFYPICAGIAIPAAIAGNVAIFAGIRAAAGDRPCGFGPGGAYYNQGLHYSGVSDRVGPTWGETREAQYAIDFTRWERNNAFPRHLSFGTPVLAVHNGIVEDLREDRRRGAIDDWNFVRHSLQNSMSEGVRYRAVYGHLDGPNRVFVSAGSWVEQGYILGHIDSTGNSVLDHLHFQIHDHTLPSTVVPTLGRTTRPTPMDVDEAGRPQELLGDGTGYGLVGNESRCIFSTNRMHTNRSGCIEIAWDIARTSLFHGLLMLAVCGSLPPDPTAPP